MTTPIYLDDSYCFEHDALVVGVDGSGIVLDRTCFYPGGGGQPPDCGLLLFPDGSRIAIPSAIRDADGTIRHQTEGTSPTLKPGTPCRVQVDAGRRLALMRHHTALHVFNTVMLREYGGWITGVSIGPEVSHIDFKLEAYSPDMRPRIEESVNAVLARRLDVVARFIPTEEFRSRPDLLRTLEAAPPVDGDRVRVVEIVGFETQACGGTHVRNTAEVGTLTIRKVDNKGRQNRRFVVTLAAPSSRG